jgi:tryptophan-rich sensory protein
VVAGSISNRYSIGVGSTFHRKFKKESAQIRTAPWAPPAKLFGPAWAINNYFLLQALKKLLQSEDISNRKKLLIKQAAIWVVFFSFGYVYFKKKSPILAAVWTLADSWLATSSFFNALKEDKKLAVNYLPLIGWTGYAGSVAVYQALKNTDPALKTPALGK